MVRDTFALAVPGDAPPGLYAIEVGWYDPATQARLPVGEGNAFRVAVLPIDWDPGGPEAVMPLDARFGEALNLEGVRWHVDKDAVRLTLRWSATSYVDVDYTVFVHLVATAGSGEALAQGDAPPLDGRWPTSMWLPGIALDDHHTVPLPDDLPPGEYRLVVGLYDPATGQRLPLADGSDALTVFEINLP
jgi:hypothetical protein